MDRGGPERLALNDPLNLRLPRFQFGRDALGDPVRVRGRGAGSPGAASALSPNRGTFAGGSLNSHSTRFGGRHPVRLAGVHRWMRSSRTD